MARKVFISFLGANKYESCHYCLGDFKSDKTNFIQVATLDYLVNYDTWTEDDLAIFLLTKLSHDRNWVDNGQINRKTNEPILSDGLQTCLKSRNYPMPIKALTDLPDGNNQTEILEIFDRLFGEIKVGDELYFDITHGFRYLPMLVVTLGNYAKFLRDVVVKSITYGNFEARNRDTNEAQIMDLISLSLLQDWTNAAASFIRNGDSSQLSLLTKVELRPIWQGGDNNRFNSAVILNRLADDLEKVTSDMLTCRGLHIENAENIGPMKRRLNDLRDVIIKPFRPIIDKVKDELADFNDQPDVMNGFHAVRWCINHGMHQQAATILQETVVSYFSKLYSQHLSCDLLEDQRDIISSSLVILAKGTPESEWRLRKPQHMPQLKEVVNAFENDREEYMVQEGTKIKHISAIYNTLASGLRNDINHNGMRNNPMGAQDIKKETIKFYELLFDFFKQKSITNGQANHSQ